ncbi:hypothetical protein CDAR_417791 [Caerostris darwini]|uniref:Maturase K n=1 Tax=Caerostris darwini TaxID=1538125 RepID=A0AAV4PTP2_9ARAC|nr:hypothetical protein CDAR_417791 [Caerostris darwini]
MLQTQKVLTIVCFKDFTHFNTQLYIHDMPKNFKFNESPLKPYPSITRIPSFLPEIHYPRFANCLKRIGIIDVLQRITSETHAALQMKFSFPFPSQISWEDKM